MKYRRTSFFRLKKEYKVLKENLWRPMCRCLPCCPKRQRDSGCKHFSFWFWFGNKNFLLHENASGKIFRKRNHKSKVEYERNKSKKIFKMCAHTFTLCSKTFVNRLFGNVFAQNTILNFRVWLIRIFALKTSPSWPVFL